MATVTFSGSVSAQEKAGEPVLIAITKPDGNPDSVSTTTDASRAFTATYAAPTPGTYQASAGVGPDKLYKGVASSPVSFDVPLGDRTITLTVAVA